MPLSISFVVPVVRRPPRRIIIVSPRPFDRKYSNTGSTCMRAADPFKVLFFGRDEFSCIVLEHLHSARGVWSSIDVVTTPDISVGRRGSKLAISPLKTMSEQLGILVSTIPPEKPAFKHWELPPPFVPCDTPPPSHLLVTASFGRILSSRHLTAFNTGRKLNVHPSLLPTYRGAAPIQHALMDGRKETGVSVIEMTQRKDGIDSGAVWGMRRSIIPDDTDFLALREKLAVEGGRLLVQVLEDMLSGKATSTAQVDDPSAPLAPLLQPGDSLVDFGRMTAEIIVRRSRGFSHQRPLFTSLRSGKMLQLHGLSALHVASALHDLTECGMAKYDPRKKALTVRCADNTFLLVSQVKQQDRVQVNAKEWWNGVRPDDRAVIGAQEGPVMLGQ